MRGFIFAIFAVAGCVFCAPRNDIGAQYLGARYVLDPLGEAAGYDPDPLIRDDAFDCTTFVETALAGGDVARLIKIRYRDGQARWENRNHFIETDWQANNADLLRNVSARYGAAAVRHVVVDKRSWARVVHGMVIDAAPVSADIEYLPYDNVKDINNTEALIVLFIVGNSEKNDKIATDIAVVHMGFLLPGGRVLRHASVGRGVVDDDFAEYLAMRRKLKNNIGIALVEIK